LVHLYKGLVAGYVNQQSQYVTLAKVLSAPNSATTRRKIEDEAGGRVDGYPIWFLGTWA